MIENRTNGEDAGSVRVGSSLLEVLFVIAKARKFLFIFIFLSVAGAVTWALLTPKTYKATASVLPAEKNDLLSSLSGFSSLAKNLSPLKSLSSLSGNEEIDKYIAILKSNSVQRDIINKFNLRKVYELEDEPYWKTERELKDNLEISIADEGHVVIDVFDHSPQRAAQMANYLVDLLNQINTTLHVTNARFTREFVEKRYEENINDILKLEGDMQKFQEKYGVIAVPEQIEATIKALAEVYVDKTKEEVALAVLKKTLPQESPVLQTKEIEISELNDKIDKMVNSSGPVTGSSKVLIPLNKAPDLANKYLNVFRNLEIQYKIAEFITPVYEQAKIEEAKNTPSVLLLDKAYPPERKAKPKILLYALIGFVASLVIGLFFVFTWELFRKLALLNPDKYSYVVSSLGPFKRILPDSASSKLKI